jgi:hypothetical protein
MGVSLDVALAAAFNLCRSTIRSRKHSTGTEYLRSTVEYLVVNEMITLLQSGEYSSALKAMTLTGIALS